MKKILICGMLLGLLSSVSVAQRGRAIGMGPTARGPVGANVGPIGPIGPNARINPSSVSVGHGGIAPNAKPIDAIGGTVSPTAGRTHTPTVGPNSRTPMPDQAMPPISPTIRPNAGIGQDR